MVVIWLIACKVKGDHKQEVLEVFRFVEKKNYVFLVVRTLSRRVSETCFVCMCVRVFVFVIKLSLLFLSSCTFTFMA